VNPRRADRRTLTINPDFSQVESDEPQSQSTSAFEVFFPRSAAFFIENAGYFETPQNPVLLSTALADPEACRRPRHRPESRVGARAHF